MMAERMRLLVGLGDDEVNRRRVHSYVPELAQRLGADVILAHALEPLPFTPAYHRAETPDHSALIDKIRDAVDEIANGFDDTRCQVIKSLVVPGKSCQTLLRFADEHDADAIVIGASTKTLPARVFVGSTAEAIARQSDRPVLLYHPGDERLPLDRVICCIDYGPESENLLNTSAEFCRRTKAALRVVHIEPEAEPYPGLSSIDTTVIDHAAYDVMKNRFSHREEDAAATEAMVIVRAKKRLDEFVARGNVDGVTWTTEIRLGSAVEQLMEAEEDYLADVMFMSAHRKPGLRRILGSTASHLLRRLPCPLLVIKHVPLFRDVNQKV
jgi:nucleotide-binding universal stress UspA family protein